MPPMRLASIIWLIVLMALPIFVIAGMVAKAIGWLH
jgi:hypothetical protein